MIPMRVSIVIPTYRSESTVGSCLTAIAQQTHRDFETIVVDSSPDDATAAIVRERFPSVTLVRSPRRLLPHAARNAGVEQSRGELIVFTDPDIDVSNDWLDILVRAYGEKRHAIVGSIGCFGTRWMHRGFHLTKFSKWLPGATARAVDNAPSGNLLVSRDAFVRVGGFPGESWSGDVELSRRLRADGEILWFEPRARGEHHHTQSLREFCRERFERGLAYGRLRSSWYESRPFALLGLLAATALPVRFLRILMLVAQQAIDANQFRSYVSTLPLIITGYIATLAGESAAYARSVAFRRPQVAAERS